MKVLQNRPNTILLFGITLVLIALYAALGIPSTEGFNPSDDGVILAQSYRMINGELPHRDFISIRPVGSAVMHLIHFYSPLPLELSARWFVLLEYLLTSILLTSLLMGSWFKGMRKTWFFLMIGGLVPVIFILNQNHYNLFPWTTIDALFWFSLALYGWYKLKSKKAGSDFKWLVLVFFSVTMSALCRQTFLLPGAALVFRIIVWDVVRSPKKTREAVNGLLPAILVGMLPGWAYSGMLTFAGSWPDFIQQLTGRTELWETGVVSFSKAFWQFPVFGLFLVALLTGLIRIWNREAGKDTRRIDLIIMIQKYLTFLIKIVLVFAVFIKPDLLFSISMAFFWILVLDIFLIYLQDGQLGRWLRPVFWILLAAWTSSISLGDNAPVFALGWLAGAALLMQVKDFRDRIYRSVRVYQVVGAGVFIASLLLVSLIVQRNENYRDYPAKQLTHKGGEIFEGLRGIMISPVMYGYLGEVKRVYEEFGSPRDRFVVWPNNAIIYPLLGSQNPFELDWMQLAEFVGSENRVLESTRGVLAENDLVILVEKVNVKWITTQQIPVESTLADYPYLFLLDSFAKPVQTGSSLFNVYRTK
jgi:hypothetical protein